MFLSRQHLPFELRDNFSHLSGFQGHDQTILTRKHLSQIAQVTLTSGDAFSFATDNPLIDDGISQKMLLSPSKGKPLYLEDFEIRHPTRVLRETPPQSKSRAST